MCQFFTQETLRCFQDLKNRIGFGPLCWNVHTYSDLTHVGRYLNVGHLNSRQTRVFELI